MNERIVDIAIEANSQTGNEFDLNYKPLDAFLKKFAELLVKKCADYADMAQDADCEYLGDAVAEYMGYGDEEGVANWRAK